ncbi:MAG: DNA recombination protein RmuC [Alphaproteobacteria bacterium]
MNYILSFIAGGIIGAGSLSIFIAFLKKQLTKEKIEKQQLLKAYEQTRENLIRLQSTKTSPEQLNETFENLAHKIFSTQNEKFKKESQENISIILQPLKHRLEDFQRKIDDSNKESITLKSELKHMLDLNQKMSIQAENLTQALTADVKVQGNWGEIILEKILEESGLRKDLDYTLQGAGMGLKNEISGAPVRPDVIVNLPENKHIIIDSKVSLTHYEKYSSASNNADQEKFMKLFLESIRNHIRGLEKKQYQDNAKLETPDFVMMFMPIEGAYISAIVQDRELHRFAWDRKIVLVGPSTLIATLKTVASIWQLEKQGKNANKIAEEGGKLYDKIVGFVDDMERLKLQMKTTQGTFDSAMNKLSDGKGSVLSKTKKLKELGAKTSKSLPKK